MEYDIEQFKQLGIRDSRKHDYVRTSVWLTSIITFQMTNIIEKMKKVLYQIISWEMKTSETADILMDRVQMGIVESRPFQWSANYDHVYKYILSEYNHAHLLMFSFWMLSQ